MDRLIIRKDSYFDSVFLMSLSAELRRTDSLKTGHVVLATPANCELLRAEGFEAAPLDGLAPTDLVIALRAESEPVLTQAEARVTSLLAAPAGGGAAGPSGVEVERPVGLDGGLHRLPHANLALISVPGPYAAYEAARALDRGLHVMVFSDNVSLEDEIALKRSAKERGLLVMGPDCGTALVGGKPLGFANRVRPGPIGLVGASGTGLQEVSCQIHRLGHGVSHILGTGGRDLSGPVGGLTALAALELLAADPGTRVLVLISKPPAPEVAERVMRRLTELNKPSVVLFLGREAGVDAGGPVRFASSLAQAAVLACQLAGGDSLPQLEDQAQGAVDPALPRSLLPEQRWLHGLFCGGTLATEALLLLRREISHVRSNLDHSGAECLRIDPEPETLSGAPEEHTVLDLGDDQFTRGRPHPMIEPALRAPWIVKLGSDRRTAVLLLDLVLGSGSHPDPGGITAAALSEARRLNPGLLAVASVTGTDLDPQGLSRQEEALRRAGALIAPSSVSAAGLAAWILNTRARSAAPASR